MPELTDSEIKAIFVALDYAIQRGITKRIDTWYENSSLYSHAGSSFQPTDSFWKEYTLEWLPSPCGLLVYTVCFFPC